MNKIKAVIFDMDGVLVDVSESYDKTIMKTAGFFLGKDVSRSDVNKIRSLGGFNNDWALTWELLRRAGREISRSRVIAVFQKFYLNKFKDLSFLYFIIQYTNISIVCTFFFIYVLPLIN